LLWIEATAVTPEGRISPDDLGLWSDAHAAALEPVLATVRRHSPIKVGLQLAHAGRKASTSSPWKGGRHLSPEEGGWVRVAPSAVAYHQEPLPTALDPRGLAAIRRSFVETALRADALGIDAVEVHAAHGYLLHEFLSPLSNQRADHFGGDLAGRMRFPLEVVEAVRAAWPEHKPLFVRVSATDWVEGGWSPDDTVAFALACRELGVDVVDCSSGGLSPAQRVVPAPDFQVPFARRVRAEAGVPTMAVGMITEPAQAEAIVSSGSADLVALARAMLFEPHWAWRAARELGADGVACPPQYLRASPRPGMLRA
jgi:2,4-dienoyl-CoA reductase-like NADH-dependent reductase (Old Yellow Enzyme family)